MNFVIQIDTSELGPDFHFAFSYGFGENYAKLQNSKFRLYRFEGDEYGYIPVIIKKSKFLRTIQILYNPVDLSGLRLPLEQEKKVLENFVRFLKVNRIVHRIIQSTNWTLFTSYPDGARFCKFGTYQINLRTRTKENIWDAVHSKHRNVIRNAIKSGATIKEGPSQLRNFYNLYSDTMRRNKMNCEPFEYFKSLEADFHGIYCAVVYDKNEPMGAIYAPYTKHGGYYVYGASREKISLTGVINYLHLNFIHFLIDKNVSLYDFVGARLSDVSGTKYEGIQKFKARFGGDLVTGYLWKMNLNPVICFLYDNLLRAKLLIKKQKFPLDIIDQESKKLK